MVRWFLVCLVGLACQPKSSEDTVISGELEDQTPTDADGDGFDAEEDCNDANASVNPGIPEICDGIDNDCDGSVDEGVTSTWYADEDGDGFGDDSAVQEACDQPQSTVATGNDCDDTDSDTHPGALERCDGVDNDCDDEIDEDLVDVWYIDDDGDGYGDADGSVKDCDPADGYVGNGDDCDDTLEDTNPDADEVCDGSDNDCDDEIDEDAVDVLTWYADTDSDGYGDLKSSLESCDPPSGHVADASDCNDGEVAVNPGADEVCDGIDNDCDDDVDDADSSLDATTTTQWYADADSDSYGDSSSSQDACDQPSGYVADSTDCDDDESAANPGESEVCDGIDNDCDDDVDDADSSLDATTSTLWYADTDSDSYGDPTVKVGACEQPSGYVSDSSDCNDGESAANPGESEVCDGIDNDCDGDVDGDDSSLDSSTEATWYADTDIDNYGDATNSLDACDQPGGYVSDATDCDDSENTINPGEIEVCDGIDNDCDGDVDDDDSDLDPTSATLWYADTDSDSYGDLTIKTGACDPPSGYVSDSSDCNDGESTVNPGESEVCDGLDNDCDGDVDADDSSLDTSTETTWYADSDSDSYGDEDNSIDACTQPAGYVSDDSDCDDDDVDVNPGESEVCDGVDNDCDDSIDEGLTSSTWYADSDSDGYGDATSTVAACVQPSGYVSDDNDCDDEDFNVNPGATEWCDGYDNDCDGDIDEDDAADVDVWFADTDGDSYGDAAELEYDCDQPGGYVSDATDCDDDDAAANPGESEVCDGIDNDCDGDVDDDDTDLDVSSADTWYEDGDTDGYGDADSVVEACEEPSGYTDNDEDCDDSDIAVNPGETEDCNGLDDDCSGDADDGGVCPCDVEYYDDQPYMFCQSSETWYSAQADCYDYDYHLLTTDDADEDAWAEATATGYSSSAQWWIGFNDQSSEGSWEWEDGSPTTHTNWASGEPNNYLGSEDCAEINYFSGAWNDTWCFNNRYFVCEAN